MIIEILLISLVILFGGFLFMFFVFILPGYKEHYYSRKKFNWTNGSIKQFVDTSEIIDIERSDSREEYYITFNEHIGNKVTFKRAVFDKVGIWICASYSGFSKEVLWYFTFTEYIKWFFLFYFRMDHVVKKFRKYETMELINNNKIKEGEE